MEIKDLLNTKEVAAYLKINEKKVYQLIHEGSIPCTRAVGKWLFPLAQINRWLEEETELAKSILIAGSDDPLLINLIEEFNQINFPKQLIFHASVGSQKGLMALATGKAQVAGVHLFHPPTGTYNLPYVEKHLAGKKFVMVNLAHRQQGLLVQPGNPRNIKKLTDLGKKEIHFSNRNLGSGTRYLFDFLLEKERLTADRIKGYNIERVTHLETGLDILRGDADAGMGIEYVAHLLNLDFIPLIEERFDLVCMKGAFSAAPLKDLFSFMEPEKLTLKTAAFRGYSFRDCGTIISS
ncbi:MAG: helix-turn-helix transcriptional regulator [Deltaproteobacteria bacterium]|nr:helix-turn-helix transcriptional regulator [Deltaproteobacteria bacterium]